MNIPDVSGTGLTGDEGKMPKPPKPETYGPFATALRAAALIGSPLCEVCRTPPRETNTGSEHDVPGRRA